MNYNTIYRTIEKAATYSGVNADASANTFTSETTEPVAATGTDRPAQFGRDLPTTGSSSGNVQALPSTPETTTTIPVGNQNIPLAATNVNASGVQLKPFQTTFLALSLICCGNIVANDLFDFFLGEFDIFQELISCIDQTPLPCEHPVFWLLYRRIYIQNQFPDAALKGTLSFSRIPSTAFSVDT